MKKLIIAVLAIMLVVCISIGATLAYLFVKTDPVVNTFAYGDIDIELWENDYILSDNSLNTLEKVTFEQDYKMVPGNTMPKNPTITVKKDSEACYLFVEIVKSENFDDFMTYEIADEWIKGDGIDIPGNVYYREVAATTVNTDIKILENDQVEVLDTVTKTMLNADNFQNPTLTFTAYAVQKANVDSVAEAWAIAQNKGSDTTAAN